jgi:hypothetical protein
MYNQNCRGGPSDQLVGRFIGSSNIILNINEGSKPIPGQKSRESQGIILEQ